MQSSNYVKYLHDQMPAFPIAVTRILYKRVTVNLTYFYRTFDMHMRRRSTVN